MGPSSPKEKPALRKADCPMPDPSSVQTFGAEQSHGQAAAAVDDLVNTTFGEKQPKPGDIPQLMAGLNP